MDFKKETMRKLAIFILLLASCDPADNENEIRIGINIDLSDTSGKTPDNFYLISPKSTSNAALTGDKWEAIANDSKDGKIHFFFFPKDTLMKYPWSEIVRGNKYTGKVSYTIEELEHMNWIISYPTQTTH